MSKQTPVRKQTLEFFKSLLSDAGCVFSDDGVISSTYLKSGTLATKQVDIEGLPVVLPTPERLNEPEGETIVFAPLCENVLQGESAIITMLKKVLNQSINQRIGILMSSIATLAIDERSYSPKMRALINKNPDLRDKTIKPLKKLISRVGHLPTQHILGIYLTSKNVEFEGRKVKRKASVSSTLLDELSNGKTWGVDMPKCDARAIATLIESIMPGVNEDNYTYGSNSTVAPNFHAIASAFLNVSMRLTEVETIVYKYLDSEALAIIPEPASNSWADGLEDLYVMEKAFPSLTGNNGNTIVGKTAAVDTSRVKVDEGSGLSPTSSPHATQSPPPPATAETKPSAWGMPHANTPPAAPQPGQRGGDLWNAQPASGFAPPAAPAQSPSNFAAPVQNGNKWGMV